jgi:electron transfer flavoprotein beta subunit
MVGRMRILVCLKQVPVKDSRFRIDETGLRVAEEDLVFAPNEADLCGLEEALRLKEKWGGEVDVLSLGAERVLKLLKNALAMGADRAIHLNAPAIADSDALVTAKMICRAISGETYHLIVAGAESEDMGHGQTGGMLAQLLGWSHATLVEEILLGEDGATLQVKRELEQGWCEWLELPVPAVLTIQAGINQPRYASLRGILEAKKKAIKTLAAAGLGLEFQALLFAGNRVVAKQLFIPRKTKNTVMLEGAPQEVARQLLTRLRQQASL